MTSAASISDFRELARRRLPPFLFEYVDGGAYAERTLRANVEDLAAISLRQRVLRDVSTIDVRSKLLGRTTRMPVILGPIGLAGMLARRGEAQAARAASARDVPFCLSTVSCCSLDEVGTKAVTPFWFQLYLIRDRRFVEQLIARAAALTCPVLVLTVDMPVPGARYRDYRSGLAGAPGLGGALRRVGQALLYPRWAIDVGIAGRPHHLGNVAPLLEGRSGLDDFFAWMRGSFDSSATWDDAAWVRSLWPGSLVIKGILDADDARRAIDTGADAIIISNHGGRQLDSVLSTARALPPIVRAVDGRVPLIADGGIRSGLDVAKFLALGADAVLLGRAWAFALAADGQRGVERMLDLLESELRVAMALTGTTRVQDLNRTILAFD